MRLIDFILINQQHYYALIYQMQCKATFQSGVFLVSLCVINKSSFSLYVQLIYHDLHPPDLMSRHEAFEGEDLTFWEESFNLLERLQCDPSLNYIVGRCILGEASFMILV